MIKKISILRFLIMTLLILNFHAIAWAAEESSLNVSSKSPQAVTSINGFLGNAWGTSFKQVKQNIEERGSRNVGKIFEPLFSPKAVGMTKLIKEYIGLGANTLINGQEHFVVLSFYNDQFYRAYAEKEVDQSNILSEFETVSNMLRQKYGEPKEKSGHSIDLVYKWIDETSKSDTKNSVRLSIEIVPPETKHYIAYNSYQTSPKPRFFINIEYQEGRNAALVDSATITTNSANEY